MTFVNYYLSVNSVRLDVSAPNFLCARQSEVNDLEFLSVHLF